MNYLIEKDKFLAEINTREPEVFPKMWSPKEVKEILSKHTTAMVDEPHHPSGMDRHDINVRNDLRQELRNG